VSCHRNSNLVASLAGKAGLSPLASKAVAAKVVAGLAGGVALLALAGKHTRRRRSRQAQPKPGAPVDARQTPALRARATVTPADTDKLTGQCPTCGASPGSKPGAWYTVGNKPYCQDCAPGAAHEAGLNLALPPDLASSPAAWRSDGKPAVKMSFGGMYPATGAKAVSLIPETRTGRPGGTKRGKIHGRILDVAISQDVELRHQRTKITLAGAGRALDTDAYVVLTTEGEETGLIIAPRVTAENGRVHVHEGQWGIMHLRSGEMLGEGEWFDNPLEAGGLAEILAQLDWARDFDDISAVEKADAGRTICAYHEALRHVK
jgi:hypothetical protein